MKKAIGFKKNSFSNDPRILTGFCVTVWMEKIIYKVSCACKVLVYILITTIEPWIEDAKLTSSLSFMWEKK